MTALIPKIGFLIQNDAAETIPPRSVVVVIAVETTASTATQEGITIHHVDQYGCDKPGNVMVTGASSIKPGKRGRAYFDPFLYVSIDPLTSDPTPGEEWGPVEGSWVITRGGTGFFAQGHSNNGGTPKRSMFLRTFVRAPVKKCGSSSSSSTSVSSGSGSNSQSSTSGSSGNSNPCNCVSVVTAVSCGPDGLSVTYGKAQGCCQ